MEASADVGYDDARYQAMGQFWLIRETDIEYMAPLVYQDDLIIRTWVTDFRRVRSRRMYEFFRNGDAEPVARASTDWVFLDRASLRPAVIPEEMILAFMPESDLVEAERRSIFPFPEPPQNAHVHHRSVEWRDLDNVGHVNNAVYLSYAEDAGLDAARAYGWSIRSLLDEGWGIFTRRTRVEYRVPAGPGDRLAVKTWLSPPRNTSITRYYEMMRESDGVLLVRAESVWVIVDLKTGRPVPVPQTFLNAFHRNIAGAE